MNVIKRTACRAIFLTPKHEILLIKISNPTAAWSGWITPGGGLDPGEEEVAGLKRELREELGFELSGTPPKVWSRFHKFSWNNLDYEQSETFFLIETEKFQPAGASLTDLEKSDFKEMRWWKLPDIETSKENFAPRDLATLVRKLVTDGAPHDPIEVGQ